MMADCLALLTSGSVWTGMTCPFTNIFGDWFFLLGLLALELAVMLRYDNMLAPSVIGIIVGVVMIPYLPPAVSIVPIIILAVNIGAALYSVIFRGEA
jgi:hypothetical protein